MRLQLVFTLVLCSISALTGQSLNTQSTDIDDADRSAYELENHQIDVNFLFGYYQQDGEHSAVTGGIGTEELKDRDFRFIVNIPLDSVSTLNASGGVNYYSSASTDKIDTKVSSASGEDVRTMLNLTYTRSKPESGITYGFGWGGSVESDYISNSFNVFWSKIASDANQQINLTAQVFLDHWVLIIPEELRNQQTELPTTDKRRSYNISANFQQVINARIQGSLSAELVYQTGLLSTPFHRVYFTEMDTAKIEKLPSSRFKIPLAIRLNYFFSDFLVLRTFFRYYRDYFDIQGLTVNLEPRIQTSPFFSFYPFYRFHHQTATNYFAPFKQHRLNERYYTSDFDLSQFQSHTVGVGLHWSPLYGIGRFKLFRKKGITIFKSIDLRYSHYRRSDGLHADLVGIDLGFSGIQ